MPLIFGESVFERRFFGPIKESDIQLQFEEHPSLTEDACINQQMLKRKESSNKTSIAVHYYVKIRKQMAVSRFIFPVVFHGR